MKKKKRKKRIAEQVRRDWGNCKPVQKVIPSKKIYNRKKKYVREEPEWLK